MMLECMVYGMLSGFVTVPERASILWDGEGFEQRFAAIALPKRPLNACARRVAHSKSRFKLVRKVGRVSGAIASVEDEDRSANYRATDFSFCPMTRSARMHPERSF